MKNLNVYPSAEAVAQALAKHIQVNTDSKPVFHLAVSGGSTPKALFEEMVRISPSIAWSKLKLYWVDERCVAPDHEESNYRMTLDAMLSKVPLPPENIFRMKGELSPQEGVDDYQKIIDKLPKKNSIPYFDLIILGMGDDGHTASIFPPSLELITIERDVAIGQNPYSGQYRLTLTGQVLRNAKELIFHVTGNNKSTVVNEIFTETGKYKSYPSYYFRDKANWWIDEAAKGVVHV